MAVSALLKVERARVYFALHAVSIAKQTCRCNVNMSYFVRFSKSPIHRAAEPRVGPSRNDFKYRNGRLSILSRGATPVCDGAATRVIASDLWVDGVKRLTDYKG